MSHPITPNPDPTPDSDDRTSVLATPLDTYDQDAPSRTHAADPDATQTRVDTFRASDAVDRRNDAERRGDSGRPEDAGQARAVSRDESPDLLTQEKAEFGGIKFGSALLGWLTTVGSIVVLAAVLAAVASGMNLDSNTSSSDLKGVGLGAAIALLVVLFLGYLAGGYVAGRMARFHGVRQGIAVWLWGVIIAIALSITAAIVGSQSTILVQANLPQIPFTSSGFTWQAILALVAVLLVTLLGAVLGGLLGMRFHRRIDRFAAANTAS